MNVFRAEFSVGDAVTRLRAGILALAVAVVSGPATGQTGAPDTGPRLDVQGTAQVRAAPDMATLRLGVAETADSAGAAIEALAAGLSPVREALIETGVAEADIQTGTLRLAPVHAEPRPGAAPHGTERDILGYRAESLLSVRVRALDELGALLDRVLGVGANRLDGVAFGLGDPSAAQDAALAAAVADAMRRAEVIAEAAGLTLGPVRRISQAGRGAGPIMARMEMASDMPVAPGEVEIGESVTVSFDLIAE